MADTWFQQSVSNAFLEAFRRCDPAAGCGASEHFMAFPAVVCAAFSAEVGLKTLLEMQGIPSRGHDLRALFSKLLDAQKLAIFEATELSTEEFGAHLAHSRLAFSECATYTKNVAKSTSTLSSLVSLQL
jgi:HEPN domain-containing protein